MFVELVEPYSNPIVCHTSIVEGFMFEKDRGGEELRTFFFHLSALELFEGRPKPHVRHTVYNSCPFGVLLHEEKAREIAISLTSSPSLSFSMLYRCRISAWTR